MSQSLTGTLEKLSIGGETKKGTGASYPVRWTVQGDVDTEGGAFKLSNKGAEQAEITLDYGRAEGGIPFLITSSVSSDNGEPVVVDVVYSETLEAVKCATGDGPFFLFSNIMNSYRYETHSFEPSESSDRRESYFAQKSQRYQRVILRTPNSAISISSIGFLGLRQPDRGRGSFKSSDPLLNQIWDDGARTVDLCTVKAGEVADAWEVTESGTRIRGQHWAPCRSGSKWTNKTFQFDVLVEQGGASWGVHMVSMGLIFFLDIEKQIIRAVEGFSHLGGIFPPKPRGEWPLKAKLYDNTWISIKIITSGPHVSVLVDGVEAACIADLNFRDLPCAGAVNTGSIAFGGPENYKAVYRFLKVTNSDGSLEYENDFLLKDKARTLADFAVGTNLLSCTVDGAKRDGALFAGDLIVIARSIFYSTGDLEAVMGSIKLLTSYQSKEGYLGNRCPIQAPPSEDSTDPSYAFYSLSYALLLVVAIKDYWMHTGDYGLIKSLWIKLDRMCTFAESLMDGRGLVVANPSMQKDWFPRCGPVFGASTKINVAYYDALKSMTSMCVAAGATDVYSRRAQRLKASITAHLWNEDLGLLKMSDKVSPAGLAQDTHAYGITTGIVKDPQASLVLAGDNLPSAFERIAGWEEKSVVSPYACGFAAEALFEQGHGSSAVQLIRKVWGLMADKSSPNYSGGHWETMDLEGRPLNAHTSLIHGWSTWPVSLLPKYLGGLQAIEPGWSRFEVRPVLAGLETIDVEVDTPVGLIRMKLDRSPSLGTGQISVTVPHNATANVRPPEKWSFVAETDGKICSSKLHIVHGQGEGVTFHIKQKTAP